MMSDECKETYKECIASHKARYQAVLDTREPWETIEDLAKRAGCGHATIERLLQSPSPEENCNKPPVLSQLEITISELGKIHAKYRKEAILNWIAENWNVTFTSRS